MGAFGVEPADDGQADLLVFGHERAMERERDRLRARLALSQERYEAAAEHARRRRLRCSDCGVRWARDHGPHDGPPWRWVAVGP